MDWDRDGQPWPRFAGRARVRWRCRGLGGSRKRGRCERAAKIVPAERQWCLGQQAGAPVGIRGLRAHQQPGSADQAVPGVLGSSVPSPGKNGGLTGVVCVKASDCWAVGSYENSGGAYLNEVLHFNGKKWSRIPTPQPGSSTGVDGLFAVTCVRASDCLAVGTEGPSLGSLSNMVQRWNGKKWKTE